MITTIIFDIDGTLLNTEHAILQSLQQSILEIKNEKIEQPDLTFVLGIPGRVALQKLNVDDIEKGVHIWENNYSKYTQTIQLFDGIKNMIKELQPYYNLGIITSKTRKEYESDFVPLGLSAYFKTVICVEDSIQPKPSSEPMLHFLQTSGTKKEDSIYIGDSIYDFQCAGSAGVRFGLALWGAHSVKNIPADYYFNTPKDVVYLLETERNTPREIHWVKYAMELQFLAQAGLTYSKDIFDIERFERIRTIAAEMMHTGSGYPVEYVKSIFCNETGFQTPKLDTRAAIFQDGKILLVKENDGRWSLPGGWVDVNESIRSNAIKEVKEEAGLNVITTKLIAVQDRNLHNQPLYAYGIAKAFVQCDVIDGAFTPNIETQESRYFSFDELPILAEEKVTQKQIKMCFDAYHSKNWHTVFD